MNGIIGKIALALMVLAMGAVFFSVGYAGAEWYLDGSKRLFEALNENPLAAMIKARDDVQFRGNYRLLTYAAPSAIAGMVLLIIIHTMFRPKNLNSARFMSAADIRRSGLAEKGGVFIGNAGAHLGKVFGPHRERGSGKKKMMKVRLRGGKKLWVDGDDVGGFVIGPPRSGKGAALIIPNALLWPDSLVVLDMRGETYKATAGHRSTFSKVIRFSPADENGDTAFYNPLDFIRLDRGDRDIDIRNISAALFPTPPGAADPYWVKDARLLFSGVTSYVMETPKIADKDRNIGSILRILNSADEPILEFIASLRDERRAEVSEFTLQCLLPYVEMSDRQFSGLYGSIRTNLAPFMNERIARATSRSSFDIRNLKRERVSLYLDFRTQQILSLGPLFNVLITQLMGYMSNSMLGPGEHRVLIMLDEFQNLGKLENVMEMATILGGYGVPCWFFVQSLKSVDTIYREEGRKNLVNAARAQVFFGAQDHDDLRYLSETLGETAEIQKDVTKTQATLFDTSYTRSIHAKEVRRPLMRPDEIRTMDRNKCIILPRGQDAIMGTRNWYFADPTLDKLAWKPLPKNSIGERLGATPEPLSIRNSDRERILSSARRSTGLPSVPVGSFKDTIRPGRLARGATFAAKAGPITTSIVRRTATSVAPMVVDKEAELKITEIHAVSAPQKKPRRKRPDFAKMSEDTIERMGTPSETELRIMEAFATIDSFAATSTDPKKYEQAATEVKKNLADVI